MKKLSVILSVILVVCMMISVNVSAGIGEYQISWTDDAVTGVQGKIAETYPVGFLFVLGGLEGVIVNENGIVDFGDDVKYVRGVDKEVFSVIKESADGKKTVCVMDKNGNQFFEVDNGSEWIRGLGDGYYYAQQSDGKVITVCVFDKTGKVHIPFGKYSYISDYVDDYLIVEKAEADKSKPIYRGVVDIDDNVIFPLEYGGVDYLGNDLFVLSKKVGDKYLCGLYDADGNEILPYEYEEIRFADSHDGVDIFVCANEEGDDGVVGKEGKIIIPFGNQAITAGGGVITVENYDEDVQMVYDYKGNKIATYPYDNDLRAIVDREGCYILYDKKSDVSYLCNVSGEKLAQFPGKASYGYKYGREQNNITSYDEIHVNLKEVTVYDIYGNKLYTDTVKNSKTMTSTTREIFEGFEFEGKYHVVEIPQSSKSEYGASLNMVTAYMIDQDKNIILANAKGGITLYGDKIAVITDTTVKNVKYGIVDIDSNTILPMEYDCIAYNEYLDLWAFKKGDVVTFGKILPVSVKVNGTCVEFDQLPVIKDDRTLVPLRAIFETLGATVEWDEATSTVTSVLDGVTVKVKIYDGVMYRNGEAVSLDVPAQIINNRTMVPVRAVSEAFGCSVDWDASTRTVIINR